MKTCLKGMPLLLLLIAISLGLLNQAAYAETTTVYPPKLVISHATTPTPTPTPTLKDFSLSLSPTSNKLAAWCDKCYMATVYVTSVGGFNDPVSLYASKPSPQIGPTLDPNIVIPPPDGTASSKLLVTATTEASPGTYVINITGVSGSVSKSVQFTLTVTGEEVFIQTWVPVIIVVVVVGIIFYMLLVRRRRARVGVAMKILLHPLVGILHLSKA